MTAAASGVHFDYNAASTGASRLDWAHAISGGPLTILLQPIDLPATTAFSIGGTLDTLDVAGVAQGHADSFEFAHRFVTDTALALTNAPLVTFAVTGLHGAVGSGGYGAV